jgi:tRNA(His) 5'-end guanylyltransferase
MRFDDLDKKMRVYETAHDFCVSPNIFMVARIDGRGFTRLTKDVCQFEAPFDQRFRDLMVATTTHLMTCGFRVIYGYTQSDEISLLLHRDTEVFNRKLRKYDSILAGEASAKFSVLLGNVAAFDCRISQLPTPQLVVDYFMWRQEDAHRNALNAHSYWALRKSGVPMAQATAKLKRLAVAEKHELLFSEFGINFNDIPAWQKKGIGCYVETYAKTGTNLKTGESTTTERKRIKVDLDLAMKEDYALFIKTLLTKEHLDLVF